MASRSTAPDGALAPVSRRGGAWLRRRGKESSAVACLALIWALRTWVVGAIEEGAGGLGRALGVLLGSSRVAAAAPLAEDLGGDPVLDGSDMHPERLEEDAADDPAPAVASGAPPAHAKAGPRRAQQQILFLSAERVLDLALAGTVPRGGGAPGGSGVVLHGVGVLGMGLQDGDVLVRVAGRPVGDPAAVLSLVLEARGRGEPVIAGEVERRREGAVQHLRVLVEQPYPTREELERRLTAEQGSLR